MQVVTSVGFHNTGSGVIDDLLREFPCFAQGGYEMECRLLQDPDGISDLEYNLVENPHRLNSGYALKRFRLMMKQYHRVYNNIFGPHYMDCVEQYIQDLTDIKYKGYWHADIWLEHPIGKYFYWARRGINKCLPANIRKSPWYNYFPEIDTYHVDLTEEEFIHHTHEFMDSLCRLLTNDDSKMILLDQLVHPNNLKRYMRYVRNLKVIVVERDPRDVYLEIQYFKAHVLPLDPYDFCKIYKDSRKMYSTVDDDQTVLYVRFEDMIYKYDEYILKVMKFIGLTPEQHKYPKTRFNPDISIKNTQLWKKYPQYENDIKIIEEELSEYLYPFDLVNND